MGRIGRVAIVEDLILVVITDDGLTTDTKGVGDLLDDGLEGEVMSCHPK